MINDRIEEYNQVGELEKSNEKTRDVSFKMTRVPYCFWMTLQLLRALPVTTLCVNFMEFILIDYTKLRTPFLIFYFGPLESH